MPSDRFSRDKATIRAELERRARGTRRHHRNRLQLKWEALDQVALFRP